MLGLFSTAQAQEGDLGDGNTNERFNAPFNLSSGGFNTGLGWYSESFLTTGFFNTAIGAGSLDLNNGDSNTAVGTAAMLLNFTGTRNTAVGTDALLFSGFTGTTPATATDNTAVGTASLFGNVDATVALKQVRERSEKIRVESPSHPRRYRIRFQR